MANGFLQDTAAFEWRRTFECRVGSVPGEWPAMPARPAA